MCVFVAVPAEGQDPGGSPQGDATGEGAVAGWSTLPGAALQAAAGNSPIVTHCDSFLPHCCSLLLYVTRLPPYCGCMQLVVLIVVHCTDTDAITLMRLGKQKPRAECILSSVATGAQPRKHNLLHVAVHTMATNNP